MCGLDSQAEGAKQTQNVSLVKFRWEIVTESLFPVYLGMDINTYKSIQIKSIDSFFLFFFF